MLQTVYLIDNEVNVPFLLIRIGLFESDERFVSIFFYKIMVGSESFQHLCDEVQACFFTLKPNFYSPLNVIVHVIIVSMKHYRYLVYTSGIFYKFA